MFIPIWTLLELSVTDPQEADIMVGLLAKATIYPEQVKYVDAGQRIANYLVYGIPVEFDYWDFIREGGKPGELAEMFYTGEMVTYDDRLAYMHMKYPEGMDGPNGAIQAVIRMVHEAPLAEEPPNVPFPENPDYSWEQYIQDMTDEPDE